MSPATSLLRDRLLLKILLPVILVGMVVSVLSINVLTPPLAKSLLDTTDKALFHTSDILIAICEERFDDLIELRLDDDTEMQNAYLQEALQQIRSMTPLHPDIETFVFREGENLLNDEEEVEQASISEALQEIQSTYGNIVELSFLDEKVRLLGLYYPFWNLHLISTIPEKQYNAPAIQARNIVIFGTFGVFFTVISTLLLLFLWRINQPLKKIISATNDIAAGNLVQIDIGGKDEIARVGNAFNNMVQSLMDDKEKIRSILDQLRDSEEQYRILTEKTLAYVAVLSGSELLFVNRRMCEALGYDVAWLTGKNFFVLVHEKDRQKLRHIVDSLLGGSMLEKHLECRFVTADNIVVWVELQANRIMYRETPSVLVHAMDITSRKEEQARTEKLEIQLEQAKKLEAIGTLAGGVAHDFNNMLGGIMGAAEMLALSLPEDSEVLKYQKLIVKSADRAASLTEQLLAFARSGPKTSTAVDVHNIIQETLVLVRNTVDKRINLNSSLLAKSGTVIGDPSHLQNMLLNLFINGAQAMPDGGNLWISTRLIVLDQEQCQLSGFSLLPGQYIEIELQDDGQGIAADHLPRIFDPFFTTKTGASGFKGTGLGLASVYGTIKQHNGAIEVTSKIGEGTKFLIQLPLSPDEQSVAVSTQAVTTGGGCILVADDEEIMRSTAQGILQTLGYEVILAEDGKQALEIYERKQDGIDLVLLDMIMPVLNGRDCFIELRRLNPSIKIILTSGFTREEDLKDMRDKGLNGFIRKPYRRAMLSQVVHEVMKDNNSQ